MPALTIFPSSSDAKATYIAISGIPGRAIDRFLQCQMHRLFLFILTSHYRILRQIPMLEGVLGIADKRCIAW